MSDETEWLRETVAWYQAKVEFYERHIDEAFEHASNGDAHLARVALTKARWERVPPPVGNRLGGG